MSPLAAFDRAFAVVVGSEGGFTNDDRDAGNWTGGRCGIGECRGTKYGISAAAYPSVDIANLTLDACKRLYRRDYWDRIGGDALPPALALLVFDAAVNNGVGQAVRWLQTVLETRTDGVLGPVTQTLVQQAVAAQGLDSVCAEYLALRMFSMSLLSTWPTFGKGWARRLCRLAYSSTHMEESA
jgi:lysozyme family protein